MVLDFIQNYANRMIENNESYTAKDLETALFKEGYHVVFCVPSENGFKFRMHLEGQNIIEGILTSSGSILL